MRAYWEVIDNKGIEHRLSCECPRFGFNEDTALGFVIKHYFAEPNNGIKTLRYLGKFRE